MNFNRKKALSLLLILVCSSTHSFWGEQKVRSMLHWLYSCRISQFFCSKMGIAPLSHLNIIQTMIEKKNNITFLKDLTKEEQSLIFKEEISPDENNKRKKLFKRLYHENNYFSLATFYLTINQFVTNQLQYLNNNTWTKKSPIISLMKVSNTPL